MNQDHGLPAQTARQDRPLPPPWLGICQSATPDGAMRVTLSGELDMATAEAVRSRLGALPIGQSAITLDLSELTFLDCAGLRCLVQALESAAGGGGMLMIADELPAAVNGLIELLDRAGSRPRAWAAPAVRG